MNLLKKNMEIIVLEKKTFEMLMQNIVSLTGRVKYLSRKAKDKHLQRWLDGQEVCELLRISPRHLQMLRNKHRIGYAQINRKYYYRPEKIERFIKENGIYVKENGR